MKRLVTLALLGLVAFRMVGCIMLSLVQIGAQQSAVAHAPGHAGSVVFRFSKRDFFQKLNAPGKREFWHEGHLFDIQNIEIQGDTLRVIASVDDFERHLIAHLNAFFRAGRRPPGAPSPTHWLVQLLMQPFLPAEGPGLLQRPAFGQAQAAFAVSDIPLSFLPDIVSPPPEAALSA